MDRPKAPASIETDRLSLRRPRAEHAESIFSRYASDPEVTRYLAWPRHRTIDDTHAFLAWSDSEWERWPAGPLLVFSRIDGSLLGSTGLAFETPSRASTGYVFARDCWGRGYATEALGAIVALAPSVGLTGLHAFCHAEHRASARVLEKCGFECEGVLRRHSVFPNLSSGRRMDVAIYTRVSPG